MRTRLTLAAVIAAAVVLIAADEPNFSTWDSNGGGADHSQYSSLKQINKNNVKQLQVAWMYESGNNPTFNPVVGDGTMYVGAQNAIVALDAATGKEIWKHQGGGAARGINYWESKDRKDRRLLFANAGAITAIDATTGETIMSFGDNGRTDLKNGLDREIRQVSSSDPGHIFENTIFMSLMPANQGDNYLATPGDVHAYDVITGKLKWIFHSVPHPGEFGYETWPADAWKTSGGVHNWNEMAVDQKRGIVFIPFGTARYDFYGPDRHGQDLFGNSIVALDARTGKRLWHFQTVHHDLWDYDLPTAPKLLTVKHDGKNVDVVAQPTKQVSSLSSSAKPASRCGRLRNVRFPNLTCPARNRGLRNPFLQSLRLSPDNPSPRRTSIRISPMRRKLKCARCCKPGATRAYSRLRA
jgi:quinoprotein glucose dehydrogenase